MKVKKGFILRDICGEHIIVAEGKENIDFNNIISMNDTAAFIWKNIVDKDFDVEYITSKLLEEYNVDKDTAKKDCQTLINQWLDAGIIE
jgi:hypothetical protein